MDIDTFLEQKKFGQLDDVLQDIFDDHVEVRAVQDGDSVAFEVEEYDHD